MSYSNFLRIASGIRPLDPPSTKNTIQSSLISLLDDPSLGLGIQDDTNHCFSQAVVTTQCMSTALSKETSPTTHPLIYSKALEQDHDLLLMGQLVL